MQKLRIKYAEWTYDVYYAKTLQDIKDCIKSCMKYDCLGLDIETAKKAEYVEHKKSGLCPHLSDIRLVQLYGGDSRIFVLDVWEVDIKIFKELLQSKKLIAHNACFEMKFFKHFGVEIPQCKCTQIAYDLVKRAEVLEKFDSPGLRLSLADACAVELGYQIPKDQQVSNWNAATLSIQQIQYAALDAVLPFRLMYDKLLPRMKEFKLGRAFNLTCRAQNAIVDMELTGVGFDEKKHTKFITKCEKDLKDAEAEALAQMPGVLNLASSKQLSTWAEENLLQNQLDRFTTTETGQYSFNAKKLVALSHVPAIAAYMKYKKVQGWTTKFGENLARHIHPETGNIHPSFWLTGIVTGRMSSSNINFQQIPRDVEFRKLFVAKKGQKLIGADYSQIETRLQGECSQDPVMLEAYKTGKDLYKVMGAKVFSTAYEDVTPDQRQIAKALVLALGYGMGATKFQSSVYEGSGLNLTMEQAEGYWDDYHSIFKVYSKWCNKVRDIAEKTEYATTKAGRLRRLASDNVYTKAPNTVIQGSAAQVMLAAMAHLYEKKLKGFNILAVVHDELICSCAEKDAENNKKELEDSMVAGFTEIFPSGITNNLVDAQIGKSWGDIH